MEVNYEGYGPGGVALLIEVATDNKNRVVAEVRHALSKNGGNMAEAGAVAWMFDKKGQITFEKNILSEEEAMEIGLDAGAEDIEAEDELVTISTAPKELDFIAQSLNSL